MDVLITGGAGFIGARTAELLQDAGHKVTALDSLSPQIHGDDPSASPTYRRVAQVAEFVQADVRDAARLAVLVRSHDAILHLAAETGTGQSMYDVAHYADVNVMGTAHLLQAVVEERGRAGRLVVASSRSVYGEGSYQCAVDGTVSPTGRDIAELASGRFDPRCPRCGGAVTVLPTREDAAVSPASIYAVTKLTQEQMLLAAGRAGGVPTIALRYQNVYGAGQSLANPYTGILSIFAREMLAGRPIEIFEDGMESRDFVHVDDVARANVLALTGPVDGAHVVNIGSGEAQEVIDVAHTLAALLGADVPITVSGRFRAGDIRHNIADVTLAEEVLGWTPQTRFADGLADFARWVPDVIGGVAATEGGYRASLAALERRGMLAGGAGERRA